MVRGPPYLILLLLSLLLSTSLSAFTSPISLAHQRQSPAQQFSQGQTVVNELRHSVAVENLPSAFGKFGHVLLSRNVVSPSYIWTNVDPFAREVLRKLDRLDWLVASVTPQNTVTIHAGFSCLDSGSSTAFPLTWWASKTLAPLTSRVKDVGGADIDDGKVSDAAVNDITDQCLQGRRDQSGLRLVEHRGQHDGQGVVFKEDYNQFGSIVDDNTIFDEILKQRAAVNPSNDVIFEKKSQIPIVIGITFETGFRLFVPESFTTQKTLELRVPMTPSASITKHGGVFLEETANSPSQPRTTSAILILTVITTGLAFLFGVWATCKHVSDTKMSRSEALCSKGADDVVLGSEGWGFSERGTFMLHLFGVVILGVPFTLAILEGKIDHRPSIEVTTGATVLYGSSNANLTGDVQNPVAGAPFQVTVWMSVRNLNEGHSVALAFSLLAMIIAAIAVVFVSSKRGSEVIPSQARRGRGWSVLKGIGTLRLQWQARKQGIVDRYKLFVELKKDAIEDMMLKDQANEVLLLGDMDFRGRANDLNGSIDKATRESVCAHFSKLGKLRYGILAQVRMDNMQRYDAALSRSGVWDDRLPRDWEYVRRKCKDKDCESIEWYRTNGKRFPPDKALALVRMGLLKYMKYVDNVEFINDPSQHVPEYEEDGVKSVVCVAKRDSDIGFDGILGAQGGGLQRTVDISDAGLGSMHPGSSHYLEPEWERKHFDIPGKEREIRMPYYMRCAEKMGTQTQ